MTKINLSIIALINSLAIASPMIAQKPKFQFESGLSIANIKSKDNYGGQGAVTFIGMERYLPSFGIGVELPFDVNNMFEVSANKVYGGAVLPSRGSFNEFIHLNYWRFPLHYKIARKFNNKKEQVFFTVGPYFAYLTNASMTYNGWPIFVHRGTNKMISRFDMGLGGSFGYFTKSGVYFRASYSTGIKNIYTPKLAQNGRLTNYNNLGLNIGFQF